MALINHSGGSASAVEEVVSGSGPIKSGGQEARRVFNLEVQALPRFDMALADPRQEGSSC